MVASSVAKVSTALMVMDVELHQRWRKRWPVGSGSGDASDRGKGDSVDSGEGYCGSGKVTVTKGAKEAVVVGQWNNTGKSGGGDEGGVQDNHGA